jgi:hypothetical protein
MDLLVSFRLYTPTDSGKHHKYCCRGTSKLRPIGNRHGNPLGIIWLDNVESVITCPACGHKKTEIIPVTWCLYFYECTHCHFVMRPLPGDCCVFCSFGTVKCPFECGHR